MITLAGLHRGLQHSHKHSIHAVRARSWHLILFNEHPEALNVEDDGIVSNEDRRWRLGGHHCRVQDSKIAHRE